MPSKQKTKGSGFERVVAKNLTELYEENFVRTMGSGAFVGGINTARKETLTDSQTRSHKGDVTPPDSFYYMNMECKFYKDFLFHQLFSESCGVLDTWIEQCLEPADTNDINIIIMKINRRGMYVCIEADERLDTTNALSYKGWYFYDYEVFFDKNLDAFARMCRAGKIIKTV